MNEWRSEWGLIFWPIPAWRASRLTMRAATCRSNRALASRFKGIGPSVRSPIHALEHFREVGLVWP